MENKNDANTMAGNIQRYLRRRSGVSLVELSRDIEGFKGEEIWGHFEKQILIWSDMSEAAIEAMTRLITEEKIKPTPADPLVYVFDGAVLKMPIAKSLKRKYAKKHWYPLVFSGVQEAA